MTKDKLKVLQKQEYDYLDTLDLIPFLNKEETVRDIMDNIEDIHSAAYYEQTVNNPDMIEDEYLFNTISSDEFASYIERRYGIKTYEVTNLYFW